MGMAVLMRQAASPASQPPTLSLSLSPSLCRVTCANWQEADSHIHEGADMHRAAAIPSVRSLVVREVCKGLLAHSLLGQRPMIAFLDSDQLIVDVSSLAS